MLLLGSELLQLCLLLFKSSMNFFHHPLSLPGCPGSEPDMSTCIGPVLIVDLSCCRALPGIAGHVVGKSVQHKESGPRASGPRECGPRAAGPRISLWVQKVWVQKLWTHRLWTQKFWVRSSKPREYGPMSHADDDDDVDDD